MPRFIVLSVTACADPHIAVMKDEKGKAIKIKKKEWEAKAKLHIHHHADEVEIEANDAEEAVKAFIAKGPKEDNPDKETYEKAPTIMGFGFGIKDAWILAHPDGDRILIVIKREAV